MKHIVLIIFMMLGCAASAITTTDRQNKKRELHIVVFATNLHCENCKKKIENNIAYEKGVKDLQVDVAEKTVTVTYRADKTDCEKLRAAIQKLGYTVLIKEEKNIE